MSFDLTKSIDLDEMADDEIEALALQAVAESGDPNADPGPLIAALKNSVAVRTAAEDPFWSDLLAKEAAEQRGDEWQPPNREGES